MSEALESLVDLLHSDDLNPWRELRENPDMIEGHGLTEEELALLRQGPRRALLRAANRPPDHTAVIMVWQPLSNLPK